ncbi:MAG: hypothetical protein AAGI01_06225, partial [Myxococcota bacterium]
MNEHQWTHDTQGVHIARTTQKFYGTEVGTKMTVLETDGGLLVHSPIAMDPASITHLGSPRWVLSPNLLHHLYAGPWLDAGLEGWAAPGLADKRRDLSFHGTIEGSKSPFGPDIGVLALTCLPMTNEVVVLHRPSRTLVVTDL